MSTMIPDWFRDGFNLLVVSIILVIYIATEITCYFPSSLIGVINQEEKAAAVTNECNALPLGSTCTPLKKGAAEFRKQALLRPAPQCLLPLL